MKRFEALARHPLAIAGALITTASAVVFIALVIAEFVGLLDNPYAGLVVFVALPARFRGRTAADPARHVAGAARSCCATRTPPADGRSSISDTPRVRRRVLLLPRSRPSTSSSSLLAGYGSLHWMESPQFCGQVCHTPMQPQFTAWQTGRTARIACAHCHIGEGRARHSCSAKLAGVRQLAHVVTGSFPIARSAWRAHAAWRTWPRHVWAATSRKCTVGDRIRVIREYADDEQNTETVTVLEMYMGGPSSEWPTRFTGTQIRPSASNTSRRMRIARRSHM